MSFVHFGFSTSFLLFSFVFKGPDQIKPANNFTTWRPDEAVKLRPPIISTDRPADEYISIPSRLKLTAAKYPEHTAIAYRVDEVIRTITFREYESICRTVAKAFLKFGLERYHGVCILGYNSAEWIFSAMATILAGGMEAGIYLTSSPDACLHYLTLSRANIVVVEDDTQAQKILSIKDQLSDLKVIIQWSGEPPTENVYTWKEMLKIGEQQSDDDLERTLKTIAINECCTLVFTSGTTGYPKAVMLSHDNILYGARTGCRTIHTNGIENKSLSCLPMSHIASQWADIFMSLIDGSSIYIADRNCLKTTLVENLRASRPSFLMSVPRVWEKLKDQLTRYEADCSFLNKRIISIAKQVALSHHRDSVKSSYYTPALYKLFQMTVYRKMKETVGLDNCRKQAFIGAPHLPEIADYFTSLDAPLLDLYGMSEASGIITAGTTQDDIMRVKILNPDQEGNGEICFNGRGVCMGYLNEECKTRESIDPDGWMRSGDIGILNDKFELKVTGRIKELVITAGGENVFAPLIENMVKTEVSVISNAVLIGDKRKYLTMLITLKGEIDTISGMPLDKLADDTKEWYRSLGCDYDTISEIIESKHRQVYQAIQEAIDRTNSKAESNAQKVQKFRILPRDFSATTEELSPSLKLKRFFVQEKYADIIHEMYLETD